ncbi:MAG: maltose/maltodextrin ABC transporter substrate-binding protein MalE [Anaerolineae bacterium]
MKRSAKWLSALLLLAVSLAPMAFASAQEEAETLLVWADNTRAAVIQEIAKPFTEEYGIGVTVQEIGLGDQRDQLLVAGPVGEGPDILIQPHDNLGRLVENGALAPIDLTGIEDKLLPSAVEAVTVNGVVYGLPYGTENVALVRNPDLIPETPATWQEVAELAAEMPEGTYAFLLKTNDTYHTFPIITAFGGYIFGQNEDGSWNPNDVGLDSPGAIEAAKWIEEMAANGYFLTQVGDDEAFQLYAEGKLGMFITGPWWLQRLRDTGQPYVIEFFPGVEGVTEHGLPFSGVQAFCISAFSEKQLLAEIFLLDYLATDEAMQAIFEVNPLPSAWLPVREAIDDPDVAGFAAAGADAVPMPNIPEMSAVWAAANGALVQIVNGQTDGETAFRTATEQIRTTIEGLGKPPESVTFVGNFQALVGCAADWDPACEATMISDEDGDGIWTGEFTLPAGDYEAKVALNAAWAEAYPGENMKFSLAEETVVEVVYDHNAKTVTLPGIVLQ